MSVEKTSMLPFSRDMAPSAGFDHLVGKEYVVEDTVRNKGDMVRLRLVKNSSGITLERKRICKFATGSSLGAFKALAGYARLDAERGWPIDELAPSSGVPDGSFTYVVMDGPALCLTSLAGDSRNLITEGDFLVSATGATTGATTSGRVQLQNIQAATANATAGEENSEQIQQAVGRGMTAKTTANTNHDILVWIGRHF